MRSATPRPASGNGSIMGRVSSCFYFLFCSFGPYFLVLVES